MSHQQAPQFSQGIGRWSGNAEVFDGQGHFLGNGADYRHVQPLAEGRVRIDVSFVGPFKHSGHYFIQQQADCRRYEGPANIGYAETLSENLVDANAYWPALGLNQRFFLMMVGGDRQLSLAQMERGEQLLYVVVGQNDRVADDEPNPQPTVVSGTHYDLQADPSAGRNQLLLHRPGKWQGNLTALTGNRERLGHFPYAQLVALPGRDSLNIQIEGGAFAPATHQAAFITNQWQAWSTAESDIVGSYSLSGGRALSGQLYYRQSHLRCWQREVVTLDGQHKAIVQHWYQGNQWLGSQFGLLHFEP